MFTLKLRSFIPRSLRSSFDAKIVWTWRVELKPLTNSHDLGKSTCFHLRVLHLQKGTVYSGTADNEQYPGFIQLRRVLGGAYQNGEAYKPCILLTVIKSASIQEQTNYGSNQNAFCIYWFLIKLQNVTMIKGIHFDNSLRMVFTRGEGAYNRVYFLLLFVCR